MDKQHYRLILYINGSSRKSINAIDNLNKYCEEHLKDSYTIEIVDLLKRPDLAAADQIFATPTLIKKLPDPIKILIGDLSREKDFLVGLNLLKSI